MMVSNAGFREVRVRAEVKLTRFLSAEHFVRSVHRRRSYDDWSAGRTGVGRADAVVAEVADATRTYLDDEGWATPQPITSLRR